VGVRSGRGANDFDRTNILSRNVTSSSAVSLGVKELGKVLTFQCS
jgi:hypothetical protein